MLSREGMLSRVLGMLVVWYLVRLCWVGRCIRERCNGRRVPPFLVTTRMMMMMMMMTMMMMRTTKRRMMMMMMMMMMMTMRTMKKRMMIVPTNARRYDSMEGRMTVPIFRTGAKRARDGCRC